MLIDFHAFVAFVKLQLSRQKRDASALHESDCEKDSSFNFQSPSQHKLYTNNSRE